MAETMFDRIKALGYIRTVGLDLSSVRQYKDLFLTANDTTNHQRFVTKPEDPFWVISAVIFEDNILERLADEMLKEHNKGLFVGYAVGVLPLNLGGHIISDRCFIWEKDTEFSSRR